MGNYLSVAAVTAVLQSLIREQVASLENVQGSVDVKSGRPIDLKDSGADQNNPAIRLYLYQTTPNTSLRNQDLPMRSGEGSVVRKPRMAVDLHYLIAFYGDELHWVPQQLLGKVLSLFYRQPVLTAGVIENALQANRGENGTPFTEDDFLLQSGLDQQVETVRLTQTTLNLEELSKLWSILFQVPYTLSVTYQASVVFLEEDIVLPQPLPVRERQIKVLPFRRPQITAVNPTTLRAGGTLTLRGQQLSADRIAVEFGALSVDVPQADSGDQELSVVLPQLLRAGINSVRIQQYLNLGSPAVPDWRPAAASNIAAFVLQPEINLAQTTVAAAQGLTLAVKPPVGQHQAAFLLLNEDKDSADARFFRVPAAAVSDPETDALTFDLKSVSPAAYFVRLMVDGAESVLLSDEQSGRYTGPRVIVT